MNLTAQGLEDSIYYRLPPKLFPLSWGGTLCGVGVGLKSLIGGLFGNLGGIGGNGRGTIHLSTVLWPYE